MVVVALVRFYRTVIFSFFLLRQNLESLEPPELRTARCSMFGQCLVGLIAVLAVLLRYPEDVDELSHDEVGNCSAAAPARTMVCVYTSI